MLQQSRRIARRLSRRFLGDRRGVTAIEFALVAPVLLLLFFTIIEFGYMLYLRSAVETATQHVARQAITGNFSAPGLRETPGNRQELFRKLLNAHLGAILLSNTTLQIETTVWNTLSNVGGGAPGATPSFGGANQIVRYQVDCTYGFLTPLLSWIGSGRDSPLHIRATAFAKNENF